MIIVPHLWVVQNFDIVVIDDFDLHILQLKIYIVIFGRFLRFKFSQQPRHGFAFQWLEIIK